MRDINFFIGIFCALLTYLSVRGHNYDAASFSALTAICSWMCGVCHAMKKDGDQ